MELLLAAYDPGRPGRFDYWAWHHPDLPRDLLGEFYRRLEAEDKPNATAEIEALRHPEVSRGGCLTLDRDWACLYRLLHGGFDRAGRHVFVLLVGFAPRRELARTDLLSLLEDRHWHDTLVREATGMLRPPASPSWKVPEAGAKAAADARQIGVFRREGRLFGGGDDRIQHVASVASEALKGRDLFHFRLHRHSPTDTSAELVRELPTARAAATPEVLVLEDRPPPEPAVPYAKSERRPRGRAKVRRATTAAGLLVVATLALMTFLTVYRNLGGGTRPDPEPSAKDDSDGLRPIPPIHGPDASPAPRSRTGSPAGWSKEPESVPRPDDISRRLESLEGKVDRILKLLESNRVPGPGWKEPESVTRPDDISRPLESLEGNVDRILKLRESNRVPGPGRAR